MQSICCVYLFACLDCSSRHIQQSLTDHFPVRRSTRKCKSMIEVSPQQHCDLQLLLLGEVVCLHVNLLCWSQCERQEEMVHKLLSQDEEGLKVRQLH